MSNKEAVKVLQDYLICIRKRCPRGVKKCAKCPQHRTDYELTEAFLCSIDSLRKQNRLKEEFFRGGITYARTELIRALERDKDKVGEQHKAKACDDLCYLQVLGLQKAIETAETLDLSLKFYEENNNAECDD